MTGSFFGTGMDFFFLGGINGIFTYAFDGGAAVSVNTMTDGSSATASSKVSARGLTSANHTVVITITGTQNVYFEGVMVYNGDEDRGIRTWEGALSGYRTTDFIDGTGVYYHAFTAVQPDLLIVGLGTNDAITATTANRVAPAAYAANLQTIIASVRAKCAVPPSVVLWKPAPVTGISGMLGTWAEYHAAIESVAQADGAIAIFDEGQVMGDQAANVYGLNVADKIHASDAGHQAQADAMMALLRAA